MARIVVMGGDGIGPEVVDAACAVLDRVAGRLGLDLASEHHLLHGACWDVHGEWVLDETVEAARRADGVLVGAVVHEGAVIIPRSSTVIQTGARVVLLAPAAAVRQVEKMFAVQLEFF